jgi:hypothetical protein
MSFGDLGRFLIGLGLVIVAVGVILALGSRIPWLGRLPGDVYVKRGNWSFYFPLATSLVVSVLLTLFFWILGGRR